MRTPLSYQSSQKRSSLIFSLQAILRPPFRLRDAGRSEFSRPALLQRVLPALDPGSRKTHPDQYPRLHHHDHDVSSSFRWRSRSIDVLDRIGLSGKDRVSLTSMKQLEVMLPQLLRQHQKSLQNQTISEEFHRSLRIAEWATFVYST